VKTKRVRVALKSRVKVMDLAVRMNTEKKNLINDKS
jgi:hypothetical protein